MQSIVMENLKPGCVKKHFCCGKNITNEREHEVPCIKVSLAPPVSERRKNGQNESFFSQCVSSEVFETLDDKSACKNYGRYLKMGILLSFWVICSSALMANNEKVQDMHQISIPRGDRKTYAILGSSSGNIKILLEGAVLPQYYANLSTRWMNIWIQEVALKEIPRNLSRIKPSSVISVKNVSSIWKVPILAEDLIGVIPETTTKRTMVVPNSNTDNSTYNLLEMVFSTNLKANFPISVGYNLQPINTDNGIILAAIILIGLYVLIIFDIIHKTVAAMLASTMSVAVLAVFNARPTMSEILTWIDVETLTLLFSMMILVTILSETGCFDYMSVIAYKLTGGKVWPLINSLCIVTALLSCILDNVTTLLLITPVTIRLCEVMNLNPVPVLINMIFFSNIGGAFTPVGDPPNVLIASNPDVIKSGINFGTFTLHMGIGVLLTLITVYICLRYVFYCDISSFRHSEPVQLQTLKREIGVWERAAASVSSYSKDEEVFKETLMKRTTRLRGKLKDISFEKRSADEEYNMKLEDLEKQYPIRDKVLLVKSGFTLILVICVFFLHSIPELGKLGLGWTALLGVIFLLLLYDDKKIEGVFGRVEWSTLLFFASLFVLMEALSRLGLIDWIGQQTQNIIMSVNQEARLAVAIILILWVSGIASAFVDNLPLTTMMLKIAANLSDNHELNLPMQPLIWALTFGASFGGNGSLLGSTSNIICAGVAEQHGYRFSFLGFMKIGLPVMLMSLLVITIYLLVCHAVLKWH